MPPGGRGAGKKLLAVLRETALHCAEDLAGKRGGRLGGRRLGIPLGRARELQRGTPPPLATRDLVDLALEPGELVVDVLLLVVDPPPSF